MKKLILSGLVFTMLSAIVLPPGAVYAAETSGSCDKRFLTLPAWYNGVTQGSDCDIQIGNGEDELRNFLVRVALNIAEIILQLAAYASVAFVIVGGYKYIVSAGSPDGMSKAKKTIANALIGLVISVFSVAIVNIVAGAI